MHGYAVCFGPVRTFFDVSWEPPPANPGKRGKWLLYSLCVSANHSCAAAIFGCVSGTRNKVDHEGAGLTTSKTC